MWFWMVSLFVWCLFWAGVCGLLHVRARLCVTVLVVVRLAVHLHASSMLLKATERSEGGSPTSEARREHPA